MGNSKKKREEEEKKIKKLNQEVDLFFKIKNIKEYINNYQDDNNTQCEEWVDWVNLYIESLQKNEQP